MKKKKLYPIMLPLFLLTGGCARQNTNGCGRKLRVLAGTVAALSLAACSNGTDASAQVSQQDVPVAEKTVPEATDDAFDLDALIADVDAKDAAVSKILAAEKAETAAEKAETAAEKAETAAEKAETAQTSAEAAALTLLVAIGEGKSEAEISALQDEVKRLSAEADKARSLLD